jgi:hemerythrin
MGDLIWHARYETGYAPVDGQHQALFKAVNDLRDAILRGKGKAEERRTLAFLVDYADTHFQAEEGLMARHHYPGLAAHSIAHHDLLRRCHVLQQSLADNAFTLQIEVFEFLSAWITQHIDTSDMAFIDYLRQPPPALVGQS